MPEKQASHYMKFQLFNPCKSIRKGLGKTKLLFLVIEMPWRTSSEGSAMIDPFWNHFQFSSKRKRLHLTQHHICGFRLMTSSLSHKSYSIGNSDEWHNLLLLHLWFYFIYACLFFPFHNIFLFRVSILPSIC